MTWAWPASRAARVLVLSAACERVLRCTIGIRKEARTGPFLLCHPAALWVMTAQLARRTP